MNASLNDLQRLAETAAAQVARILKRDLRYLVGTAVEQGRDIKLLADARADEVLHQLLAPTGLPILSEERPWTAPNGHTRRFWVVDPLDGSLNYSRGFPQYAVSIALWEGERSLLGVIYDIDRDECHSGQVGQGAATNGVAFHVSTIDSVGRAVLATGFPTGRPFDTASLAGFVDAVQSFKKIRMIGSAALSLVNVATGRFDAYAERDIWLWDVAAGLALVEAAGGKVARSDVASDWKLNVAAWNGRFDLRCAW